MSKLSRRTLVTSAAALPALAVPAAAASLSVAPDPVFAAIERDRALEAAFIARSDYEEDFWLEHRRKLEPAPGDWRTAEMVSVINASLAARAHLANTVPTTLAGLTAYLDYVVSESKDGELHFEPGDDQIDFVRSVARSVKQIVAA